MPQRPVKLVLEEFRFKVNGRPVTVNAPPAYMLLDVLREQLKLTGSKEGCGKGECGACTVWLNGEPVTSCLIMVSEVEGAEITTIEGIGTPEKLDPLQEAFVQEGAIQCGFCTPGLIMSAKAYLRDNPDPTEYGVREAISGNLCRCTGYVKVVKAILKASKNGRKRAG